MAAVIFWMEMAMIYKLQQAMSKSVIIHKPYKYAK